MTFRSLIVALTMTVVASFGALGQGVSLPQCWPSQVGGTGTKAVRVTNEYGQAFAWWCGQEHVGIVSSWEYTMAIPDKLPTSTLAALAALWAANVTNENIDPTERTILSQNAYIAILPLRPAVPPPPAPAGSYKVAPALSGTTRAAYTVVGGKLGPAATVRATVGAACDCNALKVTLPGQEFCLPAGLTAVVTLCVKP